jgi:hypothetical protein
MQNSKERTQAGTKMKKKSKAGKKLNEEKCGDFHY